MPSQRRAGNLFWRETKCPNVEEGKKLATRKKFSSKDVPNKKRKPNLLKMSAWIRMNIWYGYTCTVSPDKGFLSTLFAGRASEKVEEEVCFLAETRTRNERKEKAGNNRIAVAVISIEDDGFREAPAKNLPKWTLSHSWEMKLITKMSPAEIATRTTRELISEVSEQRKSVALDPLIRDRFYIRYWQIRR